MKWTEITWKKTANTENAFIGLPGVLLSSIHYTGHFFSFIIEASALGMFKMIDFEIIAIPLLLPVVIGYLFEYRLIHKDYRYERYFKLFTHENIQWHTKWKFRTIVFCIGGVVMLFLGIILGWVIIIFFQS